MASLVPAAADTADPAPLRWTVNLAGSGIWFPEWGGKVSLGGSPVPGASVRTPAEGTVTFDMSYALTREFVVDAFAGIPPKVQIVGTGPLAPLGTLTTTYYGPAVLALQYYPPIPGLFHPYVGAGVNWTFFLGTTDRALNNVHPDNAFGAAFEAGVHYDISPRWTINIDVKYIMLSTRITANYQTPGRNLPAIAKVDINPMILGVGIGYRF